MGEGDHRGVDVAELAQRRGRHGRRRSRRPRSPRCRSRSAPCRSRARSCRGTARPRRATYSSGGGAGSRLEMRARCGSPTSPAGHGVAHGLMRGVEAAVEADLERHAGRRHRGQRPIELGEIERDRLLAQDRLAGACGLLDQRRRASACSSRSRPRPRRPRTGARRPCRARRRRARPRRSARLRAGVIDRRQRQPGDPVRQQLGVHAADPADADHRDAQRRRRAPRSGGGRGSHSALGHLSPPSVTRRLPSARSAPSAAARPARSRSRRRPRTPA